MSDIHPFAVVTGASSGIGVELAKEFVEHGYDVMITAEDERIHTVAHELRASGRYVLSTVADLRRQEGVEALWAAVRAVGRPVDAMALNAGVGAGGAFVDNDIEAELEIIDVNVRATVQLAKYVLREMVNRDVGKVLITSSIASTMPGSFQAVYNASKSFLQSFAEALQDELRDTHVTVTSLMPGPTDTNFFRRAHMENTVVGKASKDSPADVAHQGFEGLMAGRDRILAASTKTKVQGAMNKVLPDRAKAAAHRFMAKPRS
jgi:short-subunit dehydrogenase